MMQAGAGPRTVSSTDGSSPASLRSSPTRASPLRAQQDPHITQLMSTSPRPGGLLDAMRARGTLQAAAASSPPLVAAPIAPAAQVPVLGSPTRTAVATFLPQPASPRLDTRSPPSLPASKPPAVFTKAHVQRSDAEAAEKGASTPAAKKSKVAKGGKVAKAKARASLGQLAVAKARASLVAAKGPKARRPAPEVAMQAAAMLAGPPTLPGGVLPEAPVVQKAAQPDEPWRRLREKTLGAKVPEDNYEISDKEDTDDEGAEEDQDRNRANKMIPVWCVDYKQALAAQDGLDPDSIFSPRVPFCDMDAIFPDALYRERGRQPPKRKRGSSCQWQKDRLSRSEIARYRAKMGQQKRWSSLQKKVITLDRGAEPGSSL